MIVVQAVIDDRILGEGPLVVERDELKAKFNTAKAQLEENNLKKEKLCAMAVKCMETKLPVGEATEFMWKNLDEMLKEVEKEKKLSSTFLDCSISLSHQQEVIKFCFVYFLVNIYSFTMFGSIIIQTTSH